MLTNSLLIDFVFVCMYVCACSCIFTHVCTCVHLCVHVSMYVYVENNPIWVIFFTGNQPERLCAPMAEHIRKGGGEVIFVWLCMYSHKDTNM